MTQIIPIRDLKNTSNIVELCKSTNEPVFVTKNGYGELVIMSIAAYEEKFARQEVVTKIMEADKSIERGELLDGRTVLADLRAKHVK